MVVFTNRAQDQPDLYRAASLAEAGIALAAGSDAPYGSPDPWRAMRTASRRLTVGGQLLGPDERLAPRRALDLDQRLQAQGIRRRFVVMLPEFSALSAFVRGTALLATVPGLMARQSMDGLASCEPPVACPRMPMYALWHARHQEDAAHRWVRGELVEVARGAIRLDASRA